MTLVAAAALLFQLHIFTCVFDGFPIQQHWKVKYPRRENTPQSLFNSEETKKTRDGKQRSSEFIQG